MGLVKHGVGEILPEEGDNAKTASQNWTPEDEKALQQENQQADEEK